MVVCAILFAGSQLQSAAVTATSSATSESESTTVTSMPQPSQAVLVGIVLSSVTDSTTKQAYVIVLVY